MLETLKIGFIYLYGSIPQKQRSKALAVFKENADVKVMVSLFSLQSQHHDLSTKLHLSNQHTYCLGYNSREQQRVSQPHSGESGDSH